MDYENKNKDAISTIKQALRQLATNGVPVGNMIKAINDIEEKYAESEDERIKNFLIKQANSVLDSITDDDEEVPAWKSALAWLEKQGEQKPTIEMKTPEESLGIDSDTYNKIVDECIYGEQKPIKEHNACEFCEDRYGCVSPCSMKLIEEEKPADEIKPKFHEGDWVVYCNDDVDLITGIEENGYCINNGGYIPFICENEMRLWDITDAKVGDVLVSESTCGLGTWYCIFKSLDGDESMTVYCYLTRDGRFETKKELCFDKDPYNTKPATKEQRNTLLKAMSDAGYEWDAENRQLRKIEPRQDELTEFEKAVKQVLKEAIECGDTHNLKADADMLLRLVQKSSWSEEDERRIEECAREAEDNNCIILARHIRQLKSLRLQSTWKPSGEQMDMLAKVCSTLHLTSGENEIMESIYDALKKLRKE